METHITPRVNQKNLLCYDGSFMQRQQGRANEKKRVLLNKTIFLKCVLKCVENFDSSDIINLIA